MAKALPPPQPRPATAARPVSRRPENTLAPLRVTYYRRMHLQHVYTVAVGWSNKGGTRPPAGAKPVTLRLLMAGAQVVPSEQTLDPAKPDAAVHFHVTPLAKGHLRGERLEVLIDDRKVQEIRLRSKVTSQRLTLLLLALTFLVPWFLLHYCKYSALTSKGEEFGFMQQTPGALLAHRMKQNVPDMPEFVDKNVPFVSDGIDTVREKFTDFYELLCQSSASYPLAFYAAVTLLFLTLISWRLHSAKRNKHIGKPIPLPAGVGAGGASAAVGDSLDEDED